MLARNRVDILQIRKAMGSKLWRPATPLGDDSWTMDSVAGDQRVIVSFHGTAPTESDPTRRHEGREWLHASMSNRHEGLPTYEDMQMLHRAVWGETGWSYEIHAPVEAHVNFHPRALHLWGLVDGSPALPNFGVGGMI